MGYVKTQADAALKAGNYKDAYTKYSDCLNILPEGHKESVALYTNRSLAYAKANKFAEALQDAERACELNSGWAKAWWRKATALRSLQQYSQALDAFSQSYELVEDKAKSRNEYQRAVSEIAGRMTREQLADFIIAALHDYESRGIIAKPTKQNVSPQEKRESMFLQIKTWQSNTKKTQTDYQNCVANWTLTPMTATMAYVQRACMYKFALCFKQVVADARAALRLISDDAANNEIMIKTVLKAPGTPKPWEQKEYPLEPWAWFLQGEGFKASDKSEGGDVVKAASCFQIAKQLDPENEDYSTECEELCKKLTHAQSSAVLSVVNEQQLAVEHGLTIDTDKVAENIFFVKGTLRYDCDKLGRFGAEARRLMKDMFATSTDISFKDVLIERVSLCSERKLKIDYQFQVENKQRGEACVAILKNIGDDPSLVNALGPLIAHECFVEEVDLTDTKVTFQERMIAEESSTALVEVSRPSLAMNLPYQSYSLTRANGDPVERIDKHAFCMARVHYDRSEIDQDVWFSPSHGRCRWRQSASEITVLVLGIQPGTAGSALDVDISATHVCVRDKNRDRVYLSGDLDDRVVPDMCAWDVDEDGVVTLFLHKTNLALYASPHEHSNSEWKRLFRDDGYEIKFDDTSKDYSDLPAPVMRDHRVSSAEDQQRRHLEWNETKSRDRDSEQDDLRRRNRQTRLAVLRGKPFKGWVQLDRESIPSA
eukprot:CAMPEP_0197132040 /NCGR_PEP_ID=MMETSP1390-20130617/23263_1 /TAXON_ID=38833 /ORGANISM="Micromonas sp., Strain CCMP2099" /LENGTH=711 /DNA_ID=CAMNT_0042574651 /DNA_START=46 /DNA_END=2181 /DNA_ORIENTATION=-